jgi:ribosomal protein L5
VEAHALLVMVEFGPADEQAVVKEGEEAALHEVQLLNGHSTSLSDVFVTVEHIVVKLGHHEHRDQNDTKQTTSMSADLNLLTGAQ